MKRHILIIISFVISIIIFVILVIVQKRMVNQQELISIYYFKDKYSKGTYIQKDMLNAIQIASNSIDFEDYVNDLTQINELVLSENASSGMLFRKSLLSTKDKIIKSEFERIVIPISNIDSNISIECKENTAICLYLTLSKDNVDKEVLENTPYINMKNNITFVYIKSIEPVAFLLENGTEYQNNGLVKFLVLDVSNKQALYLNSIKEFAEFNITVL